MKASFAIVRSAIAARFSRWLAIAVGVTLFYYAGLLLTLMIRFDEWPNYVTFYNWPANVARIFASTPSWRDAVDIASNEWLLEVGYINYQFGHGISEWSMTLLPLKMALIFLLGTLLASVWALAAAAAQACPNNAHRGTAALGAGTGAFFVGLTNITASWVVCCSSPSWIVGLTMLGLGVSTANWIEPIGPWLGTAGFGVLFATLFWLSRDLGRSSNRARWQFAHSAHSASTVLESA